jgi:hypothetical protein
MKKALLFLFLSAWFVQGCAVFVDHGHGKAKAPPGQVQKATGYNPASGKKK